MEPGPRLLAERNDDSFPGRKDRPAAAVSLNGDRGFHRGEIESLPANPGGNQAGWHAAKNAENKGSLNPSVCAPPQ